MYAFSILLRFLDLLKSKASYLGCLGFMKLLSIIRQIAKVALGGGSGFPGKNKPSSVCGFLLLTEPFLLAFSPFSALEPVHATQHVCVLT